jgi:YD repeat-containing protein
VGPIETSVAEFDWAIIDQNTAQTAAIGSIPQGSLLRTQKTTNLILDSNISQSVRDTYRARNLVGLATSTRVKNASGTIVAQSSISYDEYSLMPIGSVASWTDPQTTYRGNATTTSHWVDTTGTYLQTHVYYYQFGNVRTAVDAKGNQSQLDYSSSYQYAYPTTTTTAVPDPSGQYGSTSAFSTTTNFDSNTGLVLSTTDANGQTTSMAYSDSLNRLTQVTQPNGAHVSYSFRDYGFAARCEAVAMPRRCLLCAFGLCPWFGLGPLFT